MTASMAIVSTLLPSATLRSPRQAQLRLRDQPVERLVVALDEQDVAGPQHRVREAA